MPHIRLILQDDEGNPIPGAEERIYQLEGELETLDQIEQATERFKREALPEIEHSLLQRAQRRFVADRGGKTRASLSHALTAKSASASKPSTAHSSSPNSACY